jgi:2Fe-2S ferredoxin
MPRVTYILSNGSRQALLVDAGTSVMRAAITEDVDGIIAECGGAAMCATCHVYVEELLDQIPPIGEDEEEMLTFTVSPRQENSRLSCQIILTTELDGLVVQIPEAQN